MEARRNLGHLYLIAQKPNEAAEQLRAAVAADPKDLNSYFNLGVAYQMMGHKEEAVTFYKKFIELASDRTDQYESMLKAERAIYELR